MTLTRRQIAYVVAAVAALVALAVAVGYSQGRASAPEKVRVDTRIEYRDRVVEKVVTVKAKDVQRRVVTRTETQPSGASVVLRVEDVESHADLGSVATADVTSTGALSSKAEITSSSKPGWRLGVGAEWSGVHQKPDALRFGVDRRIVGPIWLGIEGSTDKRAGLRLGMEF